MKKLKWIVLVALLFGAGAGYYAYKEYNRTHADLAQKKADFIMTSMAIMEAFESNEDEASKKYADKIIEISGIVQELEEDEDHDTVFLGDEESMNLIICELEKSKRISDLGIAVGDQITIRGVCAGFQSDDLGIGSFILLQRCIIPN